MRRIRSMVSSSSAEFRANDAHNRALARTFREKQEAARSQRPQRDLERLATQGKMRPRERIEKLLDPGTPFLELSSLAANMAYRRRIPVRELDRRHRHRLGTRGAGARRRSHRQRRRLVSADGQEDRPRARHRDREPAAGRSPLRLGGRLSAAPVRSVSRQVHGRPHLPQSVDPLQDGRQAARAGVRPLHRGRRLYSRTLRLQRDRARHGRGVSRRAAAGARRYRRGGDRRGTRRRRHAHERLRHLRLRRLKRGRCDSHRTRDRRAVGPAAQVGLPARAAGGSSLRSAGDLRHSA